MNEVIYQAAIGPQQIILIAVILILLFGAKKIPELMKGVGKGIKEFKDATNEDEDKSKEEVNKKK
ncbi:MAG: twin-arginine translocase TatA/TatE family subunit [Flavobacteriales bacterium]|nr:twin-arginine translocase TatA/TatE family subunit [Flavobacteriales bacterium]|tara:strand:+ start:1371 stop:1565 length:195 start_codon:yes stop_codon:yes gene_type:complete